MIQITPQFVKYALDIMTLLLGFYTVFEVRRSAIGGAVGLAFRLVLAGIVILSVNHFLDTAYLANALKVANHTADYFQAPIVHRAINLIGFILMFLGFIKLTKVPK